MKLLDDGAARRKPLVCLGSSLAWVSLLSACSSLPNSYEMRLADHLTETGAKMYGAYWCPHCATQKDYFNGAAGHIPYVECDPEGFDPQTSLCQEMGIEAYPTWVIGDDYYLGSQPLSKLAKLSGFEGETAGDETAEDDPAEGETDASSGNFSPAP